MADSVLINSLNPIFHVCPPTDVRFWFKEQDGEIKEVKAHKMILASASEVFNRQFFGSMEAEDNIEISDARPVVFHAMVEYIYNKKPDLKDGDLGFLSSLYYLGDKYDIVQLRSDIIAQISDLKVSKENVLNIAIFAEENIHHNPLSEALYDAAAGFVKEAINRVGSKFNEVMDLYTAENEAHALVIFKLLERVKDKNYKCENCQQSPCLSGQKVTRQNFAPGATAAIGRSVYTLIEVTLIEVEDNGGFSCKYGEQKIYKNLQFCHYKAFFYKCD